MINIVVKSIVCVLIVLSIVIPTGLAMPDTGVALKIDGIAVAYNDESGYPFIDTNGITQVPIRITLDSLGIDIGWNKETSAILCSKADIVVEIPLNRSYIIKNGVKISNSAKTIVKDGITYLPIRVVMEAFNYKVAYDSSSRIIRVFTTDWNDVGLYTVALGLSDFQRALTYRWRNIKDVCVTQDGILGLMNDGRVVAKGINHDGQLNVSSWSNIKALKTGVNFTIGLKDDGTVVGTGKNDFGQCDVAEWQNISKVLVSDDFTIGLTAAGQVFATGKNENGQCNTQSWSDIKDIFVGKNNVYGLKNNSTVVASGDNQFGQCNVASWKNIKTISANEKHTVGLKQDGSVIATGYDDERVWCGVNALGEWSYTTSRCGVASWKKIKQIATGSDYTVGLQENGELLIVGANYKNELNYARKDVAEDPWDDIIDIAIIENEGLVALDNQGKIFHIIDTGERYDWSFSPEIDLHHDEKIYGIQYDLSNIDNVQDIRTEKSLVIAKKYCRKDDLDNTLVYIGEPTEIPIDEQYFLDTLGSQLEEKDFTNETRILYDRYFGNFGEYDNDYKLGKVNKVKTLSSFTEPSENIKSLAAQIVKGKKGDYNKAKAIHDWIAKNVYHGYGYYEYTRSLEGIVYGEEDVIIAASPGYARFYQQLLHAIGIPCSIEIGTAENVLEHGDVNGYSSRYKYKWNEVYVDGKWIIVDTSADSKNLVSGPNSVQKKPMIDKFFDISVKEFAKTHNVWSSINIGHYY